MSGALFCANRPPNEIVRPNWACATPLTIIGAVHVVLRFRQTESAPLGRGDERVRGIEPPYAAWEAAVLPLNYTRVGEE